MTLDWVNVGTLKRMAGLPNTGGDLLLVEPSAGPLQDWTARVREDGAWRVLGTALVRESAQRLAEAAMLA